MNSIETKLSKQEILQLLGSIRQKGSFGHDYFSTINRIISRLAQLKRSGEISDTDISEIRYFFGQDFLENTLQGMALLKKYGYAGDFMMIDKIYTGNSPSDPFFIPGINIFRIMPHQKR